MRAKRFHFTFFRKCFLRQYKNFVLYKLTWDLADFKTQCEFKLSDISNSSLTSKLLHYCWNDCVASELKWTLWNRCHNLNEQKSMQMNLNVEDLRWILKYRSLVCVLLDPCGSTVLVYISRGPFFLSATGENVINCRMYSLMAWTIYIPIRFPVHVDL